MNGLDGYAWDLFDCYLHSCTPPIVHRDLKSPNLLVDKDFSVRVCDFGLSRIMSGKCLSTKKTVGTLHWMAPEVLRGDPGVDKSCDVFSFGVILWEIATNREPWKQLREAFAIVSLVGFHHERLPLPPDLDPDVYSLISDCWKEEPGQRPTFAEVFQRLSQMKQIVPTAFQPEPSEELRIAK